MSNRTPYHYQVLEAWNVNKGDEDKVIDVDSKGFEFAEEVAIRKSKENRDVVYIVKLIAKVVPDFEDVKTNTIKYEKE